jgi:CDP-diacylglycerol--glycerol-3-phosphate 3-phosphatidyltransferase
VTTDPRRSIVASDAGTDARGDLVADPIADPVAGVSAWNVANALTISRLVIVPIFAVALFRHGGHQAGWRVIAWALFAVASLTDRIDGEIARRRGLVTEFGKLADPIVDKALIGTALVGLSLLHLLSWWITVVILIREIGVTGLRFWVIRRGVMPASRGGKIKTLLQAIAIGLLVLPLSGPTHVAAEVILGAALILTVVTGVDYVFRAVRLRRSSADAR